MPKKKDSIVKQSRREGINLAEIPKVQRHLERRGLIHQGRTGSGAVANRVTMLCGNGRSRNCGVFMAFVKSSSATSSRKRHAVKARPAPVNELLVIEYYLR